MRKNLYFYSSNLDYLENLQRDSLFEPPHSYPYYALEKCHRHEYGRIKTDNNYFHLIMGNPLQEKCPWCNTLPVLKRINSYRSEPLTGYDSYCFECPKCGSRGPLIHITEMNIDDQTFEYIEAKIKAIYQQRIPWDQDLKHKD